MDLVLASKSPRRKELLSKIVKDFTICKSSFDESSLQNPDPVEFAIAAATAKAKDVAEKYPASIVLGADTIVVLERTILGKPTDLEDAGKMLRSLSGSKHKVITGIALYKKDEDKLMTDYELTYVAFKKLTDKNIEDYLATGDHADKAGAYAIQNIKDGFVEKIDGNFENVVGLPVHRLKKLIKRFDAPEISVEITDIALPDNIGIAKTAGQTLFVPGATLHEKVRVRIIEKRKGVQYAEIIKTESPSPQLESPRCPHFGSCGGCMFQNLKYEEQLKLKGNYLLRTLRVIGKIIAPNDLAPVPSPLIYNYRNKMEFAFGEKDRRIILGQRARGGRNAVPISQCDIFSPIVKKIFPVFLEFAGKYKLPAYDLITHQGILRHLIIREGKTTGEVMIILVTAKNFPPGLSELSDKLPGPVKSFYWVGNDQVSDVVKFEETRHIWGEKFITDSIGEIKYRIYPQTFFQPNTGAAELLYDKIKEYAGLEGKESVLGLYCGSGAIELFLAKQAQKIIGIDLNPANIKTAEENAAQNNLNNCAFYSGEVEKVLKAEGFEADHIILDPPRSGLSNRAIRLILALNAEKIIYVSCNPATLARDLLIFAENKYQVKNISAFDMFPHTAHMETVVLLTR